MQEDIDSAETGEWLESLEAVVRNRGKARAAYLLPSLRVTSIVHSLSALDHEARVTRWPKRTCVSTSYLRAVACT